MSLGNKGQHLNQHPLLWRGDFHLPTDSHIGQFKERYVVGDCLLDLLSFNPIWNCCNLSAQPSMCSRTCRAAVPPCLLFPPTRSGLHGSG